MIDQTQAAHSLAVAVDVCRAPKVHIHGTIFHTSRQHAVTLRAALVNCLRARFQDPCHASAIVGNRVELSLNLLLPLTDKYRSKLELWRVVCCAAGAKICRNWMRFVRFCNVWDAFAAAKDPQIFRLAGPLFSSFM